MASRMDYETYQHMLEHINYYISSRGCGSPLELQKKYDAQLLRYLYHAIQQKDVRKSNIII
jgi:hypothetical protein